MIIGSTMVAILSYDEGDSVKVSGKVCIVLRSIVDGAMA